MTHCGNKLNLPYTQHAMWNQKLQQVSNSGSQWLFNRNGRISLLGVSDPTILKGNPISSLIFQLEWIFHKPSWPPFTCSTIWGSMVTYWLANSALVCPKFLEVSQHPKRMTSLLLLQIVDLIYFVKWGLGKTCSGKMGAI